MRLRLCWIVSLTFSLGCGRFGFGLRDVSPVQDDAGVLHERDAGTAHSLDAGRRDAGAVDAAVRDAATRPMRDGAMDAAVADASLLDAGTIHPPSSDAALDDAGPNEDGAIDGGPINLCPERADALFCDGFEDPMFTRWSYKIETNGTVSRSTTRYRSGAASLHASSGAAGATNVARYGAEPLAHQTGGEIWLRYDYYLPSSTTVNAGFSTAVVAEIEPPYFGFSLIVRATRVDIGEGDTMYQGTMSFPRDRWTCVELHVQIDPNAGVFEAYLDGSLAAHSPATNTLPAKGYTSIDVGIHYTDTDQGPVDAYVDDVVAARSRIPCD